MAAGESVLAPTQIHELGEKLLDLRLGFVEATGPPANDPGAWYAMDV